MSKNDTDHVERRRRQWELEFPEVDTRGMAILGRARVITHLARPGIEAIFSRHGLDSREFDVLSTLLRSGSPYQLRPTELFNSLMLTSGGLTGILARLERAGLIERPKDLADGRSSPVRLSKKGMDLIRTAFKEDMAHEARLIDCLTDEEQRTLSALLGKLTKALEGSEGGRKS